MAAKIDPQSLPDLTGAMLNNVPVALCRTTSAGKIVLANTAFNRLLGYRADMDLTHRDVQQWYRKPVLRQTMLQAVQHAAGRATKHNVELVSAGGVVTGCEVVVQGVYDEQGSLSGLDEVWCAANKLSQQGDAVQEQHPVEALETAGNAPAALTLTLDLKGRILDLKGGTLEQIDFNPDVIRGRLVSDVVRMENPHLMDLFLAGVLDNEQARGVVAVVDKSGRQKRIKFAARLIKSEKNPGQIEFVVRDPWFSLQADDLNQAKFDGVREMAGGIAHRLNQPLMVLNNRISEIISATDPQHPLHEKLVKVQETLAEINDIARKVGGINRYAPMDYVGGIKIVDIDQSSKA